MRQPIYNLHKNFCISYRSIQISQVTWPMQWFQKPANWRLEKLGFLWQHKKAKQTNMSNHLFSYHYKNLLHDFLLLIILCFWSFLCFYSFHWAFKCIAYIYHFAFCAFICTASIALCNENKRYMHCSLANQNTHIFCVNDKIRKR